MSTDAVSTDAVSTAPEATSATPGARSVWQSVRVPVIAVTALLLVSVGLAVLAGRGASGELDAESYEPAGSRAIVALLRDEGVTVHVARTVAEARAAAEGATVLVTHPALLPSAALADVTADAAGVVLVQPTSVALDAVGSDLVPLVKDDVTDRDPRCPLPAAARAGRAEVGGVEYGRFEPRSGGDEPVVLCYARAEQQQVPSAPLAREGRVTALGAGDFLTNDRLDSDGNAALALGLLGERADLVWFRPSLDDPALEGGSKPLHVLLPDSIKVAMLQLGIAALVIAAWRARRLGPVVAEPLPVVVRAAEATEGLARLYRRAEARPRAAASLRDAAVRSIAPRFGLPPVGADPRAVTEAVARHTGRPSHEIGELLYGESPDDDAGLVTLADARDTLAAHVRGGPLRDGHLPEGTL